MPQQNKRTWPRLVFLVVGALAVLGILVYLGTRQAPPPPTLQPTSLATFIAPPAATDVATAAPTEASTQAPTRGFVEASAPVEVPTVDWADVSVYKQAMKPAFAADVDQFVNGNRYLIAATLTLDANATISGAERVRYTNHTTDTLKDIVFRLYPNAPILDGKMKVHDVTVNGAAVSPNFTQEDSVMSVPLAEALAPGKSVELTMSFELVMTGGLDVSYGRFGYKEDVVSGTAWYPTLSVYDAGSGWWTAEPDPKGDPAYTETGLYDVRLTMPADLTVVMSGKEIETTTNADGTVTHRGVTGPMRDHAFMASKRYTVTSKDVDGTQVKVVHYKPSASDQGGLDATANVIKFASDAVSTYNRIFGEYPYAELNVVENPTPSGVEFPGLIQVAENAWFIDQPYLEVIVSHEVAHQWFYAMVGNNQVALPWLDESLASYVEIVYTREVYHSDAKTQAYILHFRARYLHYVTARGGDVTLDLPVTAYDDEGYGAIVYGKGPLFYAKLETVLGIPTVYKALNTYFKRYKYAVVTTADVEKTFEEVSGKDLSALFKQWVTGKDALKDFATPEAAPTATPSALSAEGVAF